MGTWIKRIKGGGDGEEEPGGLKLLRKKTTFAFITGGIGGVYRAKFRGTRVGSIKRGGRNYLPP